MSELVVRVAHAIGAVDTTRHVHGRLLLKSQTQAEIAIRATLAALRAFHPLSGWTGTPASFLDAFEREHDLAADG
jgi:hypothetical protein